MGESDFLQGSASPMRNFPIYQNESIENFGDGIETDMAVSPIKQSLNKEFSGQHLSEPASPEGCSTHKRAESRFQNR